jgi:hypothetical protein
VADYLPKLSEGYAYAAKKKRKSIRKKCKRLVAVAEALHTDEQYAKYNLQLLAKFDALEKKQGLAAAVAAINDQQKQIHQQGFKLQQLLQSQEQANQMSETVHRQFQVSSHH